MENIGGLGNAKAANTVEGLKQATAGYSKEVLIAAINLKYSQRNRQGPL